MKGHKVSDEVKRKISDTVRSTCNSEEWKKEHSLRTKEGMKKVESMSSVRDRYKEVKELGLLPLLGVYQDHWNNFRKYESIYGKVDINKLKKDSL